MIYRNLLLTFVILCNAHYLHVDTRHKLIKIRRDTLTYVQHGKQRGSGVVPVNRHAVFVGKIDYFFGDMTVTRSYNYGSVVLIGIIS